MITPVEQSTISPKTGVTSFTKHAAQRAMDAHAAKWGAPKGYYTVGNRAAVIDRFQQVWEVTVRLFGGGVRHTERVVFQKEHMTPGGNPRYSCTYATYLKTGGKPVELYRLTTRYPTSLEAAIAAEEADQ